MSFSFSGKHMNVGASLTHHAAEMCESVCEKYKFNFIDVSAVMEKKSFLYITELKVQLFTGEDILATGESKDAYQSFDTALHKVVLQAKKKRDIANETDKTTICEIDDYCFEDLDTYTQETIEAVQLTPNEASKLLKCENSSMVVFRNKISNCINIMFKKSDGTLNLVCYK